MQTTLILISSNRPQAGKDEAALKLLSLLPNSKTYKQSDPHLKDLCKEAFTPLAEYLNSFGIPELHVDPENWYEKKTPVTRMILQGVGGPILMKMNEQFLCQRCTEEIKQDRGVDWAIVTDFRKPEEFRYFVMQGFNAVVTIRINRPSDASAVVSETAMVEHQLDNFDFFDHVIENDGTLEEFKAKLEKVVKRIKEME